MMTAEAVVAGVYIHRIGDRCFVRLEQLIAHLPDNMMRAELLAYLWKSDESGEGS